MMGAADKPPLNGAARKPPHTTHAPTLTHSLGDPLRKVIAGTPVVARSPAANEPPPPPKQKQRRTFLEAHERRQAIIDYHRLGKTAACAEWGVSQQTIPRWIELTKLVAEGKPIDPRHRGEILGVTTAGSTRETAQAILRECLGVEEPPPEPEPPEDSAVVKRLRETNEQIIQTRQIPERAAPPPLPPPDPHEREARFMELRARIAGLEAELNRLTVELRRSDKTIHKLTAVIHQLTEKDA